MFELIQSIFKKTNASDNLSKENLTQTQPSTPAQQQKQHGLLPGELPREIWLEISSYLIPSPKALLNLTETHKQLNIAITGAEDLYYTSMLDYFSDALVSDETIAKVAGDSRIKFESNRERFLFLKANLIDPLSQDISLYNDPNQDKGLVKIYSGCFANRDFLDILLQLNCWKLISLELLEKHSPENLVNFALSAINHGCLPGFIKIIETLDYDRLYEIFKNIDEKKPFCIEALQILIATAKRKTTNFSVFSLNSLTQVIIHNNDAEFEDVLNSNEIDKEATYEHRIFYSQAPPISRTLKALFLQHAISTRQYQKLRQLLSRFYGVLDEQTIGNHIILSCEKDNLEAVKIILDTFPRYAISEKFIGYILLELTKNEVNCFSSTCFEYLLLCFQKHASDTAMKDFFSAFISLHNSASRITDTCHYVRVLKILLSVFGSDFLNKILNPVYIKILTEYSDEYWDKQDILTDAKIQQNTIPSLLLVVASGNSAALRWVLKHQIDINEKYISHNGIYRNHNANSLCVAIQNKLIPLETRLDIIEQLLDAGIDTTNVLEWSPLDKSDALTLSIDSLEPETVSKICRHPNTQCSSHWSNLTNAAFKTDDIKIVTEVTRLFPDRKMRTVHLMSKEIISDAAIFSHMLDASLDINQGYSHSPYQDRDAVYYAVKSGRLDTLKILLGCGADLNKNYKTLITYGANPSPNYKAHSTEIHNTLSLALHNDFFNIAEFLIQQGAEVIPTKWYILEYENLDGTVASLPIFQLLEKKQFRLLTLALDKIKGSVHSKKLSSLSNTYFDNPQDENSYIPTLGIGIIYAAVTSGSPGIFIERLIDDLKINLNHAYINKDDHNGPSFLHKLIDDLSHQQDFRDIFIPVFSVLIKKGADPFQIYKGQSVFTRLAEFGLWLSSGVIKNYSSQQLNDLCVEHSRLLCDPNFEKSHKNLRKNLHIICSSNNPNLDALKKLYYFMAYKFPYGANDANCFSQLLASKNFDPNKIISMHPQKDNASKDKIVLSLLKLMNRIFVDDTFSVNITTMRFINSCRQFNKTNKNPGSSNQNKDMSSLKEEITQIAEKLSDRCSAKNLQSPAASFPKPPETISAEKAINNALFLRQR